MSMSSRATKDLASAVNRSWGSRARGRSGWATAMPASSTDRPTRARMSSLRDRIILATWEPTTPQPSRPTRSGVPGCSCSWGSPEGAETGWGLVRVI